MMPAAFELLPVYEVKAFEIQYIQKSRNHLYRWNRNYPRTLSYIIQRYHSASVTHVAGKKYHELKSRYT